MLQSPHPPDNMTTPPTSSSSSSSDVGLGVATGVTATVSSATPSFSGTSSPAPPSSRGGVTLGVDGAEGTLTVLAVVVDSKSALYSCSPLLASTSAWKDGAQQWKEQHDTISTDNIKLNSICRLCKLSVILCNVVESTVHFLYKVSHLIKGISLSTVYTNSSFLGCTRPNTNTQSIQKHMQHTVHVYMLDTCTCTYIHAKPCPGMRKLPCHSNPQDLVAFYAYMAVPLIVVHCEWMNHTCSMYIISLCWHFRHYSTPAHTD